MRKKHRQGARREIHLQWNGKRELSSPVQSEQVTCSWQWEKHAWLYSELPQALKGEPVRTLGTEGLNFCGKERNELHYLRFKQGRKREWEELQPGNRRVGFQTVRNAERIPERRVVLASRWTTLSVPVGRSLECSVPVAMGSSELTCRL